MLIEDKKESVCHKCRKKITSNAVKVEILYENPEKGKHDDLNYYHKGCLMQLRSLARKSSNIRDFDINNSHHIKTLAWAYFKSLFHGGKFQPIFDEKTIAKITIYNFEKELGFPIKMTLNGVSNFKFED